ncbi:MAG TPA: ATP-binding protein [Dehalococcoidia bacterium]|nr:ATP-binding protein [Dehalococcoidia bacterium]
MGKTIVVAGKGGVGKTAIAALLIDLLSQRGVVLAIDADPSTNLNTALGLPLGETVGRAREDLTQDMQKGRLSPTISKQDVLDMKIREALVESERVDLLAMGRPEGPGCYCAANHMLRISIDRLAKNYDYTVIDSEAGMEHISRQTTRDVDILIIVSDPTMRGITAAGRMRDLIGEMRTKVGKVCLVVNRIKNGLPREIDKAISDFGLSLMAIVAEDPNLAELEIRGSPIIELPEGSPLRVGVKEMVAKLEL